MNSSAIVWQNSSLWTTKLYIPVHWIGAICRSNHLLDSRSILRAVYISLVIIDWGTLTKVLVMSGCVIQVCIGIIWIILYYISPTATLWCWRRHHENRCSERYSVWLVYSETNRACWLDFLRRLRPIQAKGVWVVSSINTRRKLYVYINGLVWTTISPSLTRWLYDKLDGPKTDIHVEWFLSHDSDRGETKHGASSNQFFTQTTSKNGTNHYTHGICLICCVCGRAP